MDLWTNRKKWLICIVHYFPLVAHHCDDDGGLFCNASAILLLLKEFYERMQQLYVLILHMQLMQAAAQVCCLFLEFCSSKGSWNESGNNQNIYREKSETYEKIRITFIKTQTMLEMYNKYLQIESWWFEAEILFSSINVPKAEILKTLLHSFKESFKLVSWIFCKYNLSRFLVNFLAILWWWYYINYLV